MVFEHTDRHYLKEQIRQVGIEMGFTQVGFTSPEVPPQAISKYMKYLELKYHAGMKYMETRIEERINPLRMFPSGRTVIVVTLSYYHSLKNETIRNEYRIARYAMGKDYHIVMRQMMKEYLERINQIIACNGFICVDSMPVLERAYGVMAGIGWIGKNTMLISPKYGSYFFIGVMFIDYELPPDPPFTKDLCGTCSRCIEACPTGAITPSKLIDSSKCISYCTIEMERDVDIPEHVARNMQKWLFGCDICQEVCPWNRFAKTTQIKEFMPRPEFFMFSLVDFLNMGSSRFRRYFGDTPLMRAGPKGMRRNAKALLSYTATGAGIAGQGSYPTSSISSYLKSSID